MNELKPGFNPYITNEDYHGNKSHVSSSALKMILKDPRSFYKTYILGEKEEFSSSALSLGSYIHSLILEPHLTEEEFAIFEGGQRRGKKWEEFQEENKEKIIVTRSQANYASTLVDGFRSSKVNIGSIGREKEVNISSFFEGGKAEETLCVNLEGIDVKVRFDYRKVFEDFGSINDIKTTSKDVSTKEKAAEVCNDWWYDLSAALYVDAVTQETGLPHDFYFVFLSKFDNQTYIYKASESFLQRGRDKYKSALEALRKARETNVYFSNTIEELA